MNKCKYPNCKHVATRLFALQGLCEEHFSLIDDETALFHKRVLNGKKLRARESTIRVEYYKIAPLISWSKFNLEKHYVRG